MPPLLNSILLVAFAAWILLFTVELLRDRRPIRFAIEVIVLLLVLGLLHLATGFPVPSRTQAFGGLTPIPMIGLMYLFIVLGIGARYFFYLRGAVRLTTLLKPLCVSPMVLLPLLGLFQGVSAIDGIQVVSFCILAFQNGFFWPTIFEGAHEKIRRP